METNDLVLAKITKLLALRDGKGATPAEAALAAEHIQRLLQKHNLSLMELENRSGQKEKGGKRLKSETRLSAARPWQVNLMRTLAKTQFCLHQVQDGRGVGRPALHVLVGRDVNIQATVRTYEYLRKAVLRELEDAGYSVCVNGNFHKDGTHFLDGASDRLCARLTQRHEQATWESRRKEEERRKHAGDTSRALVLADVYGSEEDENNDLLNGFPPGTTAARRRAEETRRQTAKVRFQELIRDGMEQIAAWYVAHGYGAEEAARMSCAYHASVAAKKAAEQKKTKQAQGKQHSTPRRKLTRAYFDGQTAGERIGLDEQVKHAPREKIGHG